MDYVTYCQQVDGDSDLIQFAKTLENNILIVSIFEDLLVVMFQELELGHDDDNEDGGKALAELSQEGRNLTTSTSNICNDETELECYIPPVT